MSIFIKYNTLSWYGETESSNAEYNYVVREQLPDFPVTAFDECDVRPLVERAGANVVVHCSCGHREESDDLPYDYKFLFVSKMTDSKGDMHFTVHVSFIVQVSNLYDKGVQGSYGSLLRPYAMGAWA